MIPGTDPMSGGQKRQGGEPGATVSLVVRDDPQAVPQ